jgi:hypothetical protein
VKLQAFHKLLQPVTVLMLPVFALIDYITAFAVLYTVSQLLKNLSRSNRCSAQQQLSSLTVSQISDIGHISAARASSPPLPHSEPGLTALQGRDGIGHRNAHRSHLGDLDQILRKITARGRVRE